MQRVYGKTKLIDIQTLKRGFEAIDFVKTALLFGSRVQGDWHCRSDYDFAVLLDECREFSFGVKAEAFNKIEEVFGLREYDFDLVDLAHANEYIVASIRDDYVLLKGEESEVQRVFGKYEKKSEGGERDLR